MSGPPTLTDDAAPAHLDTSTPPSQDASPTPQNNQLDQNDLSTAFDKLQITDLTTQPTTVPIQDYDSDEYEAIQYESDESWDCSYHVHRMSKMDIRLYEERRVLERQEPIQAHLEALHQAFWNVDPEYTVFAFGGTVPKEEISCEELVLRVWKDAGKKEGDVKDNTDGGSGTNNGGNQEASIKDGEGEEEGLGDVQEAEFRFPLIGEQVDKLLEYATTSPFGKGNETVVDPYYRKAMEITPDRFTLEPNPIFDTEGILNKIAATLHMKCKLRAEMAKLNIYTKGGFFRKHCDTPRSPEHIGTIVVGLPGAYYGGDLKVRHGGPEVRFDWGTSYDDFYNKKKGLVPSSEIRWAFLYGDCEHEVWHVSHGARLTVAYDVFTVPDSEQEPAEENTTQSDDIYQALQIALADHEGFAKDGCTLAFGLSHSYPKTTKPLWEGLEDRLKGVDAVLLQAVTRSGLTHSFRAAFHREEDPNGHWDHYDPAREWGKAQMDNLSATTLNAIYRKDLDRFQVILTDKPDAVEGCYHWNINGDQDFFEDLDRELPVIKQLVWVDLPQSYGFRNDYTYVGNGPCDRDEAYSGVVMLIEIPPADRR